MAHASGLELSVCVWRWAHAWHNTLPMGGPRERSLQDFWPYMRVSGLVFHGSASEQHALMDGWKIFAIAGKSDVHNLNSNMQSSHLQPACVFTSTSVVHD